jgi:uncharacterized protein
MSAIVSASSRGRRVNTGNGPTLQIVDIDHPRYVAVLDPDAAFWSLVQKKEIAEILEGGRLRKAYLRKRDAFMKEIHAIRFAAQPLAVYFNPTERCNLNCHYCYIPEEHRRDGVDMDRSRFLDALQRLRTYFTQSLPKGLRPQIVFHGSEPLLVKDMMFEGIEKHRDYFRFGVQTNGTLLDEDAVRFLTERGIGIGLSLDSASAEVAGRTRTTWNGDGVYEKVIQAMERLKGYPNYNVICTVTRENMGTIVKLVDFLHAREVPVCMLNPVRCTREGARRIKPADHDLAKHYFRALDRTYTLYRKTGRKLVVANFANILVSLVAPAARRLMCDISPCGGGRCFFALSARGDMFPCSEFLGVPEFKGGNLFEDGVDAAMRSPAFATVTGRKVEDIEPCRRCAVRHFCGSPCPAEAHEMNGGMKQPGAFCELYEEQVRYALRLLADGRETAYLWEGWDKDTKVSFDFQT